MMFLGKDYLPSYRRQKGTNVNTFPPAVWDYDNMEITTTKKYFIVSPNTFYINSLAPGRCGNNFRSVILKHIFRFDIIKRFSGILMRIISYWNCPHETTTEPFHDKATLPQVMAWCRQASSHYLSQCSPRSSSPHGVTLGHNELWWKITIADTFNSSPPSAAYMRQ